MRWPSVFQGHPSNFKVTRLKKIVEFDPGWAFPDCNSSLNSPIATKWCTKLEVAQKRCPIVFQGHRSNFEITRLKKIVDFDPNWAFPDCNSSLNSPMVMKCCTKLEATYWVFPDCNSSVNSQMVTKWCTKHEQALKRCPIAFQGHLSNFKVTRL